MIKPTAQDLELCRLQGSLFEESPALCACSSAIFVRRFMNSQLATRFDDGTVLFESSTPSSFAAELEKQYGTSDYGSNRYSREEPYWMGCVYRYWSAAAWLPSKCIFRIIQARELRDLYYSYHSLDPLQAIERICEAKGVSFDAPSPSVG